LRVAALAVTHIQSEVSGIASAVSVSNTLYLSRQLLTPRRLKPALYVSIQAGPSQREQDK